MKINGEILFSEMKGDYGPFARFQLHQKQFYRLQKMLNDCYRLREKKIRVHQSGGYRLAIMPRSNYPSLESRTTIFGFALESKNPIKNIFSELFPASLEASFLHPASLPTPVRVFG